MRIVSVMMLMVSLLLYRFASVFLASVIAASFWSPVCLRTAVNTTKN
jgi:hypothetical protein